MESFIKFLKKSFLRLIFICFVFIFSVNSFEVIGASYRGVLLTFGKPSNNILLPGMRFKVPFVQKIEKISSTPILHKTSYGVNSNGAITKDMQTLGCNLSIYWQYNTEYLVDIVREYNNTLIIERRIDLTLEEILKDEVGKLTSEEIVMNITNMSHNILEKMRERLKSIPIKIIDVNLNDIDWSDSFDNMIQKTMERKQEVERMKQEVALREQETLKKVKEAEAALRVEELNANAVKVKAEAKAQAKRIEADSILYYNNQISKSYTTEIKLKELEIELEKAKRWDGRKVPLYVPLTASGVIVDLEEKNKK